jgi:hypothetical protein
MLDYPGSQDPLSDLDPPRQTNNLPSERNAPAVED